MTKNIDKLFDAEQEVRNHSRYIANTTINIKKYISEKTSGIANAIAGANRWGNSPSNSSNRQRKNLFYNKFT